MQTTPHKKAQDTRTEFDNFLRKSAIAAQRNL